MKKIYLAGPITGLSYNSATNWRLEAIKWFNEFDNIEVYSPMREKDYLEGIDDLQADCDVYSKLSCLSSNRGVFTRDYFDVTTSDIILVNLLGAKRVSIGTMFEYGWAWAARKPIITAIEDSGNIHDHGFVKEATGFRVNDIIEGYKIAKKILLP